MFRRSNSRDPNLSAYVADGFGRLDEEDEEESEEEPLASSQDYRRPQLDPKSEGINSCSTVSIFWVTIDDCKVNPLTSQVKP